MSLDFAVSRAVAAVALLEAALHSREAWFIEVGGVRRQAVREVHETGVTFRACFLNVTDADTVSLFEDAKLWSTRPFDIPPNDGEFCVPWTLALPDAVLA